MAQTNVTRRDFVQYSLTSSIAVALIRANGSSAPPPDSVRKWRAMRHDPARDAISGKPDLDSILGMFPRTTGEPAFDPREITERAKQISTTPKIKTGHPFLDRSIRVGLAHIDATFQDDHPKYGVGVYAQQRHDGFPPTIIAAIDALSAWGLGVRAAQLFRYWLTTFVREDGTIKYYGPSISEYGQLLHSAALLSARVGPDNWWQDGFTHLDRIAEYLLGLHADAIVKKRLIAGVPEADTRRDVAQYFHNNAWVVKGLHRWAELCQRRKAAPTTATDAVQSAARRLADNTLRTINATWPRDSADWWLPPQVEPLKRPSCLTGTREASYTNYRYWPELLSSDLLPRPLANRVVNARLTAGGQFCGMTRFADHLDDWPLAEYLYGLWKLDEGTISCSASTATWRITRQKTT